MEDAGIVLLRRFPMNYYKWMSVPTKENHFEYLPKSLQHCCSTDTCGHAIGVHSAEPATHASSSLWLLQILLRANSMLTRLCDITDRPSEPVTSLDATISFKKVQSLTIGHSVVCGTTPCLGEVCCRYCTQSQADPVSHKLHVPPLSSWLMASMYTPLGMGCFSQTR